MALATCKRLYTNPGMRLAIASLLLVAASGCLAPPSVPVPMELKFPDNHQLNMVGRRLRALAESVAPAYVKVVVATETPARAGRDADTNGRVISGASGIVVDPAGYVVTAGHIARRKGLQARVTTFNGNRFRARVVHVAPRRDLALLKILDGDAPFQAARPARSARPDQPVLALGTPGNRPGAVAIGRVARPIVDKRARYGDFGFDRAIELRLQVAAGYSGGPVFNAEGLLVGMIAGFDLRASSQGRHVGTGSAYAIPAADLMAFVHRRARGRGNIRGARFVHSQAGSTRPAHSIDNPTGD